MKLFDVTLSFNVNVLLSGLKRIIMQSYELHKDEYKVLLNRFNEEQINSAINSIFYQDNAIYAPTSGINGIILRYLEYGGAGVKANKILTKSSRIISRKVNGENYVF